VIPVGEDHRHYFYSSRLLSWDGGIASDYKKPGGAVGRELDGVTVQQRGRQWALVGQVDHAPAVTAIICYMRC
jgi:hypothetical protein